MFNNVCLYCPIVSLNCFQTDTISADYVTKRKKKSNNVQPHIGNHVTSGEDLDQKSHCVAFDRSLHYLSICATL